MRQEQRSPAPQHGFIRTLVHDLSLREVVGFLGICGLTVFLGAGINYIQTANRLSESSYTSSPHPILSFLTLPLRAAGDEEADFCGLLGDQEPNNRCYYSRKYCEISALFNYVDMHYCTLFHAQWASYIIMVIAILVLFMLLGSTASDFFVPALQDISSSMRLSDNVAGVTFLALGNGAPDLFSMIAGVSKGAFEMSLSEAMGSGIFINSIVLGSVGLVATFQLDKLSLFMDALVYLGTVIFLLMITVTHSVYWPEAAMFPLIYGAYVTAVVVIDRVKRKRMSRFAHLVVEDDTPAPDISYSQYIEPSPAPTGSINSDEVHRPPTDRAGVLSLLSSSISTPLAPSMPVKGLQDTQAMYGDEDMNMEGDAPPKLTMWGWVKMSWGNFVEWSEWKERSIVSKIRFSIELPFTAARMLTIPSVFQSGTTRLILNCIYSPIFLVYTLGFHDTWIKNGAGQDAFPMWAFALILSAIMLPLMLFFNQPRVRPTFHLVFTFWNFVLSVCWINMVANELVALLQTLGVIFGISEAILGSTVLAWGNSIVDLVSNVAVAREGQPKAAVAACYASPLLNALLGLGISVFYSLIVSVTPGVYTFTTNSAVWFTFSFLIVVIVLALIVVPANRMRMTKPFAVALYCVYGTFLVITVCAELGLFKLDR
ncbi:Ca2+:Cation Antiporter [Paratrimastix pyriformis]|uniref:Ca2+:Cation Antiporter n=1 Tax=Paratrimastix pyriformis TaxID=342808 RepID=A0ABQ8UBL4_9EUKA|nr:Ca2+:Cation Antiporter [Paratrimastix pyriformis]